MIIVLTTDKQIQTVRSRSRLRHTGYVHFASFKSKTCHTAFHPVPVIRTDRAKNKSGRSGNVKGFGRRQAYETLHGNGLSTLKVGPG